MKAEVARGPSDPDAPRVLAVASFGGHWSQLQLLKDAFAGCAVTFAVATNDQQIRASLEAPTVRVIPDCNRNTRFAMFKCLRAAFALISSLRPTVVVTTGALPGLMVLAIGRAAGARGIWIESIANAERLSMSGRMARRLAGSMFVQSPELAEREKLRCAGSVL